MITSRNAPCPCGSGRKYKRCCYMKDRAAETKGHGRPALPAGARAAALAADRWEADIVPMSASYEDGTRGRTVVSLVVAGGPILDSHLTVVNTADPGVVGLHLVDAMHRAAERLGAWPRTVAVRYVEFADVLTPALSVYDCDVVLSPRLPELDEAARALLEHLLDGPAWPPRGEPETWDSWGYPPEVVSDLFRAWARLYRAEPWTRIEESRPIMVSGSGGPDLIVSVLGEVGLQRGVVLYQTMDDYLGMYETEEEMTAEALSGFVAPVVFLGASERHELPPAMQREVLSAGWEVAAPDGYPHLMTFQSPGGCLPIEGARRLVRVLDGLADLTEHAGDHLSGPDRVQYRKHDLDFLIAPEPPEFADPGTLLEGLGGMEFEDEDQAREWLTERLNRENATPLEALSGLSPDQAHRLLEEGFEDGSPLRLATDLGDSLLDESRFVHNARVMLQALVDDGGTKATDAGNLNRAFVASMLDRMRLRDGTLDALHAVNKVVNEEDAWNVHHARIMLELARLVHRRRGRFVATRAGKALVDPNAAGTLAASLLRAYFSKFNLAYLDGLPEEPVFQHVVPLTLWRIGVEGREWHTTDELADRVLPSALRHILPVRPGVDRGAIRFERRIVRPLLDFGLLEEAPERDGPKTSLERLGIREVRVVPLFDRMIRFEWGEEPDEAR